MDLNKYLNKAALPEIQYSKEEYAAMKKTEREAVWVQVDARMGEVLADAPALQEFLNFMSQCRNSLPNQLLLSGQNADITDARTFQQWKDAGRHIPLPERKVTRPLWGRCTRITAERLPGIISARCSTLHRRAADLCHRPLTTKWMNWSPRPSRAARCRSRSRTVCRTASKRSMSQNRTIYVRNGMDAGTTLCAIVRECAQADFHKDYTYNRQAYAAPSYCAAYMVAHRYGLDTAAFNFDRVVALYGNLGKEQQRGFLSDVNIVGGGLLRSLSRTLAVQTREPPTAEYAVAMPSAKKQSRQRERG